MFMGENNISDREVFDEAATHTSYAPQFFRCPGNEQHAMTSKLLNTMRKFPNLFFSVYYFMTLAVGRV
jgi:hypothetical protein